MQDTDFKQLDIDLEELLPNGNHITDAYFYSRKADYFRELNESEKVIESLLSCIRLDPHHPSFQKELIKSYLTCGKIESAVNAAKKYATDSQKKYDESGWDFSDNLHELGEIMSEAKLYNEALYFFQKALDSKKLEKDEWSIKSTTQYLRDIAEVYGEIGDTKQKQEYYTKCAKTLFPSEIYSFLSNDDFEHIIDSLICCQKPDPIHVVEELISKNSELAIKLAHSYAKNKGDICQKDKWSLCNTLHSLGVIMLDSGHHNDAILFLQDSVDNYNWTNEDNDIEHLANFLFDLARAYGKNENLEKAIEYYKKSIDTELSAGKKTHNMACCYRNLCNNYRGMGQTQNALNSALKAYDIWKNDDDKKEELMEICQKIGHIYFSDLNLPEDAIKYYEKTKELAEELCYLHNDWRIDIAYRNLAQALFYSGDYKNALEAYQHAIKINTNKYPEDDNDKVWVWAKIGRCCAFVKKPSLGIEAYTNAIEMHKRLGLKEDTTLANYYDDMGVFYDWSKNKEKALDCFEKAYKIVRVCEGEKGWTTGYVLMHMAQMMKVLPTKRKQALLCAQKAKESFVYQKRNEKDMKFINDLIASLS